jgi:hypothetical protein
LLTAIKNHLKTKQRIEDKITIVTEKAYNRNHNTAFISVEKQILPDLVVSIGKKSKTIMQSTNSKHFCIESGILAEFPL